MPQSFRQIINVGLKQLDIQSGGLGKFTPLRQETSGLVYPERWNATKRGQRYQLPRVVAADLHRAAAFDIKPLQNLSHRAIKN
ncbi:hypothetical protein GCM10010924_05930 [Rhizobium wenxiniae]|nr:hypothetical protein GCM10010924_05930 [Rhizobium wenxiniae]